MSWLTRLGVVAAAADLDGIGATVPDSGGVRFVPALAGLGAPHWRPDARGAFLGLSLGTSRAHLIRAVLDGLAASVALLARAVAADLGQPLTALRADGGLTRSRLLLQAQADLLQIPVEVPRSPDATALGVAALARLGTGQAASLAEAVGPRAGAGRGGAGHRAGRGGRAAGRLRGRGRAGPGSGPVTASRQDPAPQPGSATRMADVLVVGAGVVGTAIARTLAQYELSCVLVEAGNDVGTGTTKANTAILHTGFDAVPGTLESRLVRRGARLLADYAGQAGIPLERTGALLVAWTAEQLAALAGIEDKSRRNGYTAIRPVPLAELHAREPHLGPGALGALEIPDESIICPWTTPLAFATEAVRAGVRLLLDTRVTGDPPGRG